MKLLYLVDYPFELRSFGVVSFSPNALKFHGYRRTLLTISEPTESARIFHGVLALPAIMVDPKPGHQVSERRTAPHAANSETMRAFTVMVRGLGGGEAGRSGNW